VKDSGSRLLNSRALAPGIGDSMVYRGIVIAPGFELLHDFARGVLQWGGRDAALAFLHHRFPPLVLLLAGCSMLASGLTVQRLLRPLDLPRAAKFTWIVVATFSGLIGLVSFYFGTYRHSLITQRRVADRQTSLSLDAQPAHR
jgi:hypothetical protein